MGLVFGLGGGAGGLSLAGSQSRLKKGGLQAALFAAVERSGRGKDHEETCSRRIATVIEIIR